MTSAWADTLRAGAVLAALCLSAAAILAFIKQVGWRGSAPTSSLPRPAFSRLGSYAIDPSRRISLIELDGARALLLTGGKNDVMLPWPPTQAPPAP